MTDKEFKDLRLYTMTMLNFKALYNQGLISLEDYCVVETNMAKKYGLEFSVLYRIIIEKGLDN